ncbi:MAG: hypothetical protein AB7O50_02440 [Pseudolabrys sp.]
MPQFSACAASGAPVLPQRWHATALLLPFANRQLDVGEFTFDGTLPAMRATLYGLESGAADLLITDKQTFLIQGSFEKPTGCVALGAKYRLPPQRWMVDPATCIGEAPVARKRMRWWKTAGPDGRARWHWYDPATRLPWRLLRPAPTRDPAVIGEYAISYFPEFQSLQKTDLGKLRDFCVANAKSTRAVPPNFTAYDLMAGNNPAAEAERDTRIKAIMPGVSHAACGDNKPPRWPDQFVTTAVISPIMARWDPLPSVIYYDWTGPKMLATVMHLPHTNPPVRRLLSALTNGIGYSISNRGRGLVCQANLPGVVRPDWMSTAGCRCNAVIDNPALSPMGTSVVRACPIKWQPGRVMWTSYTGQGAPVLFVEAGASGSGVMLADYDAWLPGMKLPAISFELPKECVDPGKQAVAPGASAVGTPNDPSCGDCHTAR